MKLALFKTIDVTIILTEEVARNCSHVRISEWVEVEFPPRDPTSAEVIVMLDAEERSLQRQIARVVEKRAALQEATA